MEVIMNSSENKESPYLSISDVISSAARRCGVSDGFITPEIVKNSKQNLFWTLMEVNSKGSPIFTLDKQILGLNLNQVAYPLSDYTYNVKYANWRQTQMLNYTCEGGVDPEFLIDKNYYSFASTTDNFIANMGENLDFLGPSILGDEFIVSGDTTNWLQRPIVSSTFPESTTIIFNNNYTATATANNASLTTGNYTFNAPAVVQLVGTAGVFFYGDQRCTLTIDVSEDKNTWTTIYQDTAEKIYEDGEWVWVNLNPQRNVAFVRASCADGQRLTLRGFYLADTTTCTEVTMGRLNIDTYGAYVNKTQVGVPLSYYFEKQIEPILYLWQEPQNVFDYQIIVQKTNAIDTPTSLTGELQIPRWYQEAVVWNLAARMIFELPSNQVDMGRLPAIITNATNSLDLAMDAQNDKNPISFASDYSCYTR